MKFLTILALAFSAQNLYAGQAVYLIPVQQVIDGACEYPIRDAVAKIAGPEMLAEIQYYKSGKTAKQPFKSCCGIENWPTYESKDFSADDIVWGELTPISEDSRNIEPGSSMRLNPNGTATFTVTNYVSAKVPQSTAGFMYEVVTTMTALPSSQGWMARFSGRNPAPSECVSRIERLGSFNK